MNSDRNKDMQSATTKVANLEDAILKEAVDKIGAYNRFGSKPGLERVTELCRRLGNPQDRLKAVHVAGTNGKGSVSRYLYSVFQACGYRAGLFTSPYLERFTERIEFDGNQISPEDLLRVSDLVIGNAQEMVVQGLESPTEFEVVTAIALSYFEEKKADFIVLEVGLGGRGDSTNVIRESLVSAITSISLDHTEYLGETIEQIAWEKAGIIKENGILVSDVCDERAKNVIRQFCADRNARFIDATARDYAILQENQWGSVFDLKPDYPEVAISMMGRHQVRNAICALSMLAYLKEERGISLPDEGVRKGMKAAKQTGRIELLSENPYLIIDGAHNLESVQALRDTMSAWFSGKKMLVITGILKDKDVTGMTGILASIGTDFIATEPDNPRKLSAEILAEHFRQAGVTGQIRVIEDSIVAVETVMTELMEQGNPNHYEGVLFTGSLYLIGKLRTFINNYKEGRGSGDEGE